MNVNNPRVNVIKTSKILWVLLVVAGSSLSIGAHGAKSKYTEIAVANGGIISGKVVWEGTAPVVPPLSINKNVETCDKDGTGQRASVRLQVSGSGGIANAVVFLSGITSGKALEKKDLTINQQDCAYAPHITIAPKKSNITLNSMDEIYHNIHMFGAASYNIPFPDQNSVAKLFRKAGLVRIQCDGGHGWMSSYIHVVTHPYYAVTDSEGNFQLSDVPPGEYTLTMWHEDWVVKKKFKKEGKVVGYSYGDPKEQSLKVTVGAGGAVSANFTLSE